MSGDKRKLFDKSSSHLQTLHRNAHPTPAQYAPCDCVWEYGVNTNP